MNSLNIGRAKILRIQSFNKCSLQKPMGKTQHNLARGRSKRTPWRKWYLSWILRRGVTDGWGSGEQDLSSSVGFRKRVVLWTGMILGCSSATLPVSFLDEGGTGLQHQARPPKGKFQNLEVEGIGSKASKSESLVEQNGSFFPEHLEPLNKRFCSEHYFGERQWEQWENKKRWYLQGKWVFLQLEGARVITRLAFV